MIAASVLTFTLIVGLVVGVASGQPLIAVPLAIGLTVGYATAFLTVPALRAGRLGTTGAAIDDANSGWTEFHRELARARRFDGRFALVRLDGGDNASGDDLIARRDRIATVTRRIDRVWIDGADILLLLPEATTDAVDAAFQRLRDTVPEALQVDPGIAIFPEHGITSGSLISAAYGAGIENVPTPITTARAEIRSTGVSDAALAADRQPPAERAGSGG